MPVLTSEPMPKGQTDGERKATSTARLPVDLLRQARVVAAFEDIDLGDYLVRLLKAQVEKDYDRIVTGVAKPPTPKPPKQKPKGD